MMNLKFKSFKYSKDVVLDALRVYIGVALVGKGIYFIQNLNELFELTNTAVSYGDFILSHYIIFAHIGLFEYLNTDKFPRLPSLTKSQQEMLSGTIVGLVFGVFLTILFIILS